MSNIPKRAPTTKERIAYRLSEINRLTGLNMTCSIGLNGYRLEEHRNGNDLTYIKYTEKDFLELLTTIHRVLELSMIEKQYKYKVVDEDGQTLSKFTDQASAIGHSDYLWEMVKRKNKVVEIATGEVLTEYK